MLPSNLLITWQEQNHQHVIVELKPHSSLGKLTATIDRRQACACLVRLGKKLETGDGYDVVVVSKGSTVNLVWRRFKRAASGFAEACQAQSCHGCQAVQD